MQIGVGGLLLIVQIVPLALAGARQDQIGGSLRVGDVSGVIVHALVLVRIVRCASWAGFALQGVDIEDSAAVTGNTLLSVKERCLGWASSHVGLSKLLLGVGKGVVRGSRNPVIVQCQIGGIVDDPFVNTSVGSGIPHTWLHTNYAAASIGVEYRMAVYTLGSVEEGRLRWADCVISCWLRVWAQDHVCEIRVRNDGAICLVGKCLVVCRVVQC